MRVDQDAPLRLLRTAFLPDDWIAVLLKSHGTGEVVQRVGPVNMVLSPRFQSWLRFKNAGRFSVFVGVNAITVGRRSRTRESVGAVRHVFLDADQDASRVLDVIAARPDLPPPSYVVRSSKGRAHVMWRVEGFGVRRVEALQKHWRASWARTSPRHPRRSSPGCLALTITSTTRRILSRSPTARRPRYAVADFSDIPLPTALPARPRRVRFGDAEYADDRTSAPLLGGHAAGN